MPRNVGASVVQLIAGVLLLLAAIAMPWSLYTSISPKVTTEYRSGSLGVWLAMLALASIALSLGSLAHPSRVMQRLQVVIGSAALVVSIALSLRKISAVNQLLDA